MILGSSTKMKKSFASIFGCVELHLLCLLTVARQTMLLEVRSMPDWHRIGTNLVRMKPPITSVIVSSGVKWWVWSSSARSCIWRQISSVQHVLAELFVSYESIVDTQVVLLFALSPAFVP